MINNPFTSDIFTTIWLRHFNKTKPGITFSFIEDLNFVKHRFLNLYTNVGKTLTKGISYSLNNLNPENLGKKVFLIYDVPTYFVPNKPLSGQFKRFKIKQYPGYLIELQDFKTINDYMVSAFNRKSRYKIRSYKNKLEGTFRIHYKMYYGDMSKNEYDRIFEHFRCLLKKRFKNKGVSNNNLEAKEWSFYKDMTYPMILARKASMYVVFDKEKPIGIMLNYVSKNAIHVAITVFDMDYSKFNVGTVNILNLIEWSLENNFKIVDFSKGHYDYKMRWGSLKYDFEYHILYNSSSLYSSCLAFFLQLLFKLKQYLRAKGINELFHKFTFYLKRKTKVFNKFSLMFLII